MRLISQDGMIDVPYEISALSTGYGEPDRKYNIYIRSKLLDEKPCVFATYSAEAKALKVMEMLRDCYLGKDCGYRTEHNICYPLRNDFETKVFKFPADSEIEV